MKWFVGRGVDTEFICVPCAEAREKGQVVETARVCGTCFEYFSDEVADLRRAGGSPEIRSSPSAIDGTVVDVQIPKSCGLVVDIAAVSNEGSSVWLLLGEDGRIWRFNAETRDSIQLAKTKVPEESNSKPFQGRQVRRHLHASANGEFAAVVNDYGHYGAIIDLRSGQTTLKLNGGDYHPETVPFSFAFISSRGKVLAIHRTAWNRLDVSDASSGNLLTRREPTSYRSGESRPPHYLDYFHGGLCVNAIGSRILDDGWIWHPYGFAVVWDIDPWLSTNIWESEDGPTRKNVCGRDSYWDSAVAWLDADTLVIAGIGEQDIEMVDGARVFDVTTTGKPGPGWRSDLKVAREISTFAGPAGKFFGAGGLLYSSDEAGLSRWDTATGARTGQIPGFKPIQHHSGAGELVQISGRTLFRWRIG